MRPRAESEPGFRAGATLGQLLRGVRFAAVLCVLSVSIDAGLSLASGAELSPARLFGWLAGLGLGLLWLAPLCALIGWLAHALELGRASRRALSWLQGHEPARVGALLAAGFALALMAPCAALLTERVILSMARPDFAAVTIVSAHLLFLGLGLLLFALTRELGATLVQRARAAPLRAVLATPMRLLGALLSLGALTAVALLVAFWSTLRFLPWGVITSVGAALALSPVAIAASRRRGGVGRAAFDSALAVVGMLAVGSAIWLSRASNAARGASLEPLAGKIGNAALLLALDVDRDEHLGLFGGGDCAPLDPLRHPGAIDVPENGIDEDCDGDDLNRKALGAKLARSFPLPSKVSKRPPIVLITIDTFAAKRLRVIGDVDRGAQREPAREPPRVVTPRLDAFAKQAAVFRKCFAQGPSTRLSFPSIFTSRWDSQLAQKLVGRHPYPIESSERMLAEVLREAGYDTVAILSDGYFTASHWPGLLQGFASVNDAPLRAALARRDGHNSTAVTDAALATLRAPRKAPLFLWAHYYDAHSPHTQPNGAKVFGQRHEDVYDAELWHVDAEVGRLLDGIEESFGDRALRVITADHGIAFDPPRHVKLNYGYDLSTAVLHVPLLFSGLSIKPQVLDGLVSTMDVAPTLANIVRVKKRLPFRGASLVPELFTGKRQRPERLHHQFFLNERKWQGREPLELASVRTDRYSLVSDRVLGTFELYDYVADYFERRNLADDAEHKAVLHALKQQLSLYVFDLHGQRATTAAVEPKP